MTKKKQLTKKKESSDSDSQKNPSQQEDMSNDEEQFEQVEPIPDNMDIPFQEYRKSFSVFKSHKKSQLLYTYIHIKSESQFIHFSNTFSSLLNQQNEQINEQNQQIKEKRKENQYTNILQHCFLCKIPSNTTIFIHLFQIDNKRCNIKVSNASGYVYAYFTDIRLRRKFYKIYKILKKIGNNTLYIIYDELRSIHKEDRFVQKISDYAKDFCYYCNIESNNLPSKFLSINLQKQRLIDVRRKSSKQNQTFVYMSDDTFWFFSQIFAKHQENFQTNLKKMRIIQLNIENPSQINQMKQLKDSRMEFIIKCILINFSKSQNIQTKQQILESFNQFIQTNSSFLKYKSKIQLGNPKHHFPEQMNACKQCIVCQKQRLKQAQRKITLSIEISSQKESKSLHKKQKSCTNKKINKNFQNKNSQVNNPQIKITQNKNKTKYRCQGCTASAKKDIPLCLSCFQKYHQKKLLMKQRYMKKVEKITESRKQKEFKKLDDKQKNSFKYNQEQKNYQDPNKAAIQKSISNQYQSSMKSPLDQFQNSLNNQSNCEDSQYSANTSRKTGELNQNEEFMKLLSRLQTEKNNFIGTFSQLIKQNQTRNVAIITAQYVKFKALTLLGMEKK